ncbi:hypothetical protein L211DRAFT_674015 [Terfezia boudieri ATCC MYA-4762]|uniref:Uncharacterized protein n=1 Tax=Terfezia boudieri ATCC MYA-4762 TaxID=1051890 RepID=A0A3N4L7P1_9PEZI|nr:hypothetical protein L211DRAFT_674015 [Terfezia boudieri ATCC MYA-4762]
MLSQRIIRSILRHHVPKIRIVKHFHTADWNLRQADNNLAIIYGFTTTTLFVGGNLFYFFVHRPFETQLRTNMNNLRTELRSDMKEMEATFYTQMKDMKAEMKNMKAELKSDFKVQLDTILALLVKRGST